MNSYTNDSFYENMSHQTDAAPYSVHYTEAAVDCYISIGIMKWSF